MKLGLSVVIALFFLVISFNVSAQVRVTGHASAEVVESVSAQNSFNRHINVNNSTTSIDLGSIRILGATNSAYDVQVNNATIYNGENNYSMTTDFKETVAENNAKAKDISLSALLNDRVINGDYDGKLTVIVSYN